MTNNPTEKALIARGFDSGLAAKLRQAGQTLDKLKRTEDSTLISLGLSQEHIRIVRQEPRPPIPQENLAKVLFANRWVCCVCRDATQPIVVHHIREWALSRDHSVSNLAVLCLNHHGEVHTIRQLAQNLTATRVAGLKSTWEETVCREDATAIQQGSQLQAEVWFYFNHMRLYELALELGVDLSAIPGFPAALNANVCNSDGTITKVAVQGSFMYADSDRMPLYRYALGMLRAVLAEAVIRNISDHMDRGLVGCLVVPGDIVFVQGAHTFSPVRPAPPGSELARGVRKANGVSVSFVLDLAEATSMSAWSVWLRGHGILGSLVRVQRVQRQDGKLLLVGTVLAIRSSSDGLKERTYELGLYKAGIPQQREAEAEAEAIIANTLHYKEDGQPEDNPPPMVS